MTKFVVLASVLLAHLFAAAPAIALKSATAETSKVQGAVVNGIQGLPIYSSDGEKVGRVVSADASPDGSIKGIRAEIEAFLGLGTGMVSLHADQFARDGDRIVLAQTADQVRGVPGPSHQSFDRAP